MRMLTAFDLERDVVDVVKGCKTLKLLETCELRLRLPVSTWKAHKWQSWHRPCDDYLPRPIMARRSTKWLRSIGVDISR